MSYGYDTYYPPTEYAQPQADPYFVHPNSAAAQLGLTPEEVKEVVEEQERWFREEYQQELVDRARESTEHQEQHQDEARWVPTPSISDSEPTPQAYGVPDESPEDTTSPYDNSPFERGDSPATWYQPPTTIPDDGRPLPPPLGYTHNTTQDPMSPHVECHDKFGDDAIHAGAEHDNVAPPARDAVVADDAVGDWAGNVEEEM
jgi:hypothetical protein